EARDVAHDDAVLVEARHEFLGVAFDPGADERRLIGRRDDLEALREQRPAACGGLCGALEAPLRRQVESGAQAGKRRRRRPAGVEARSAEARDGPALRLVALLREI